MQATPKRSVEKIKAEKPLSSRKSDEDKIKKTINTPRNYLHKTTAADIYGKKKLDALQAPKKVFSPTTHTAGNVSPMKGYLKSTPSCLTINTRDEKAIGAKVNLHTARKANTRIVKAQAPANVTVNSPTLRRRSDINFKKKKITIDSDDKASNITIASVNDRESNMAEMFIRERSKTRTLEHKEVKVLKEDAVDNNAEMKNLSRRLSAQPKAFYVDLSDDQVEKEKSSEGDTSYEDDFESYESDFDSYHSDRDSDASEDPTTGGNEVVHESNVSLEAGEERSGKENEERMLDSGSYDLRDPQRSAQKVKTTPLDFIVEASEDHDKKPSLTDEGFQDMASCSATSSMKTMHVDILERPIFMDFIESRKNRRKRRVFEQLQRRATDILCMVTLHEITYMLFEMKPIPYDLYMATFGRSDCAQISVQTFDDGITVDMQTDDILYANKWTQIPVKFSKYDVHLNAKVVNRKSDNDFLTRFTNLLIQKADCHDEVCEDMYKVNPLRIHLEQKDGVGSDRILPQETYKTKLKQSEYNVNRLKRFLKRSERMISGILSLNAGSTVTCKLSNSSKFSFSKGYVKIPTKSVTNTLDLKITNVIFSSTKANLFLTVHEKSDSDLMRKCVLCVWDLSGTLQEPVKVVMASNNVIVGQFRGDADGFIIAALKDGTIQLWDLSEEVYWTPVDTEDGRVTNLVDIDSNGLPQSELDREWNLQNSRYDKNRQCPMQISVYTSSGNNVINRDDNDCIVALEFMGESQTSCQHGGRKFIARVCSLQRIGILVLWSIVQEKSRTNSTDIGKAYWSKLALEKLQTIHLMEFLDVHINDRLHDINQTFNLNAAKRRLCNKRQGTRPNPTDTPTVDRPRSAANVRNRKMLPTQKVTTNAWETGIVCYDMKIMRLNNTDYFIVAKNCGEMLCCTRNTGVFKVNRFCLASDTSSITCLEISQNGLPYILAATESGTINLCRILDFRVLLTLDCSNRPSTGSEKYKTDTKGRFISSFQTDSIKSSYNFAGKEKMAIRSVTWPRSNPMDMIAVLDNGTACLWRLTTSDIIPHRLQTLAAACAASSDTMALVTTQNEVEVHRLVNDKQTDNLELFKKYIALL